MLNFGNFARITSLSVGFHFGTLMHAYVFHSDFWPNLNFLLKNQIKLVLKLIPKISMFFHIFNVKISKTREAWKGHLVFLDTLTFKMLLRTNVRNVQLLLFVSYGTPAFSPLSLKN